MLLGTREYLGTCFHTDDFYLFTQSVSIHSRHFKDHEASSSFLLKVTTSLQLSNWSFLGAVELEKGQDTEKLDRCLLLQTAKPGAGV